MTKEVQMIKQMFGLQDQMNLIVASDWRWRGFDWNRAVYMEVAEMIEAEGWKWWKYSPTPDHLQQKLELVDIFHFLASWALLDDLKPEYVFGLSLTPREPGVLKDKLKLLETLMGASVSRRHVESWYSFWTLCEAYELKIPELFRIYVSKGTLNRFRQENGYKDGSYQKLWGGREDNVHLEEIMDEIPVDDEFSASLYQALEMRYKALCS